MNTLKGFLSQNTAAVLENEIWGVIQLEVSTYLTDQLPPLEWVTSVRAIVHHAAAILVVRDPDRLHILPGGRREDNETVVHTLRREILEETGWEVGLPRLLGIMHFHHLTPKPADYLYPYPDFLQLIYRVDVTRHVPTAKQAGGYELSAEFVPLSVVKELSLSRSEQVLLSKAISRHK